MYMDFLLDRRGNCMSIIFTIKFPQYRELIDCSYKNRGGIEGQRGALKSSTAIRIRKRMIDDIVNGTILPPVVIGAAIDGINYEEFRDFDADQLTSWLIENADNLSLIDGMQRTTAMIEASKVCDLSEYCIRVELWLAQNVNSLIYRMLILNSGQVPWDVRRQLETVFSNVLKQIENDLPEVSLFHVDEGRRRRSPKQYQANNILELYLVFGSRKVQIDVKERLSDEFVRLDFLDLTANQDSTQQFSETLSLMSKLDDCISKITTEENADRFMNGIDVFSSQPACVGFIAATSILMLGRPGNTQPKEQLLDKWNGYKTGFEQLLLRMNAMSPTDLSDFLALPTLSEKLSGKKSGKVGDFEREFFRAAFLTLYEEGNSLSSFEVCWNAY